MRHRARGYGILHQEELLMNGALYNFVFGIYILVAIGLVVAVGSQTSKHEGLSGTLGGKIEAAPFIRKKTWEDQLNRVTGFFAWSFLILSTVIVLFFQGNP